MLRKKSLVESTWHAVGTGQGAMLHTRASPAANCFLSLPSNDAHAWLLLLKGTCTRNVTCSGNIRGRKDKECGHIGVNRMPGTCSYRDESRIYRILKLKCMICHHMTLTDLFRIDYDGIHHLPEHICLVLLQKILDSLAMRNHVCHLLFCTSMSKSTHFQVHIYYQLSQLVKKTVHSHKRCTICKIQTRNFNLAFNFEKLWLQ